MRGDGLRRGGALGAERARSQFAPHVRFDRRPVSPNSIHVF